MTIKIDNCLHLQVEQENDEVTKILKQENMNLDETCVSYLVKLANENGWEHTKNVIRMLKTYDTINVETINDLTELLQ